MKKFWSCQQLHVDAIQWLLRIRKKAIKPTMKPTVSQKHTYTDITAPFLNSIIINNTITYLHSVQLAQCRPKCAICI